MRVKFIRCVFYLNIILSLASCVEKDFVQCEVLVIGEGTGAISSAIAASRGGAITIHSSTLPWVGGMLTSAGVSATDGNHQLAGGIWKTFRDSLRNHYGGADSLYTGWVSNTMFEPQVGERILQAMMTKEHRLTSLLESKVESIERIDSCWEVSLRKRDGVLIWVKPKILIDGTDLGDVIAEVGVDFSVGMDAKSETKEKAAFEKSNDIIQDLTYVGILRRTRNPANKISKPENYQLSDYQCACERMCDDKTIIDCDKMLEYGLLPNDKFMLNWPKNGNDFYASKNDLMNDSISFRNLDEYRESILQKARNKTLGFVYYLQHELGYNYFELDSSAFPSYDGLALYPYYREGRRLKGISNLTLNEIIDPYKYNLYRQGIAVGDYPVDHHHLEKQSPPEIDFPVIPSFSIPLGSLIPASCDGLIVADKAISVSNLANGTTRLQPVVLQIGEAAGILASIAIINKIEPRKVSIRNVQDSILHYGAYIMPFIDTKPGELTFDIIQRIGATGIMRGEGVPYKWANQTWFYPDSIANNVNLIIDRLNKYYGDKVFDFSGETITISDFVSQINLESFDHNEQDIQLLLEVFTEQFYPSDKAMTRVMLAILIDLFFDPFHTFETEH